MSAGGSCGPAGLHGVAHSPPPPASLYFLLRNGPAGTYHPCVNKQLSAAVAAAICCLALALIWQNRQPRSRAGEKSLDVEAPRDQAALPHPRTAPRRTVPGRAPAGDPQVAAGSVAPKASSSVARAPDQAPALPPVAARTSPRRGKPPILDPLARNALSLVGADADAETYWINAINNPRLGEQERQDLIEDLNEDGFSDPHRPGLVDLPLIQSRLLLIDQLAPFAMDQVNADAFAEARKDLQNMVKRLTTPN